MIDLEKGCLLAAHANDASDVRFDKQGAKHLGDGFKFVWGIEPLAQLLAVISGKRNRSNAVFTKSIIKALNQPQNPFIHFAKVPLVGRLVNDLAAPVDHNTI